MELQTKAKNNDTRKGYVESIVEDLSNLSASTIRSPISSCAGEQAPGPSAWALVGPLFRGLSHLSKVYAYHGMFRETMYYAEQAYKLVKDLGSDAYTALALAMTGDAWLNAGTLDTASELLSQAKQLCLLSGESCTSVVICCRLGKLHRLLDNPEAELEAYNDAQTLIEILTSNKYISNIDQILDPAAILEEEMCRLTLKAPKPKGARKVANKKAASTRSAAPVAKTPTEMCPSTSGECIRLSSLRGLLLRQKASAFVLRKRFDEAVNALKEANAYSTYLVDNIDQRICFAKQLLFQSVEQMEVDPVFGVLQDSTISFPAIANLARVTGSGLDRVSVTHHSPPGKIQVSAAGNRSKSPSVDFFDKLKQAQDHLKEAHSMALQASSTAVIQNLSSLLNTITIFLSAAGTIKGRPTVHPNFAACSMGKYHLRYRCNE
jgi:separase